MEETTSYDQASFLAKFTKPKEFDGLSQNTIQGYFNWRKDGLYFSPGLGPCPFVKMPGGTRVIPNQTYNCPFPFGTNRMWIGRLVMPNSVATNQILKELGFGEE